MKLSYQFRIGTEQRSKSFRPNTPGPGQYTGEYLKSSLKETAPKFTISSKAGSVDLTKNIVSPGPGMYAPKFHDGSSKYTMRARPNTTKAELVTPGVGNYEIRSEKSLQVPSYKYSY